MSPNTQWTRRWKSWVAPTRLPGVWKRKEGGYFVRARVTDPTTGKLVEIKKVLHEASEAAAFQWLTEEKERLSAGTGSPGPAKTRFSEYAASLMERKVARREIKSARCRERWRITLTHLIVGTHNVPGFGDMFMDQVGVAHVEAWQTGIAKLIVDGQYAPTTANGWLAILKMIFKSAQRDLGLTRNPVADMRSFDTSEHVTYTEEQPNALTAEEAARFLEAMRSEFPQHYAMTYLGFALGLRPSSMRPLRRRGPTPDVLWDEGVILVRRSHTLGDEVMNRTKNKLRQRITVPDELLDVLRWHVSTQLTTPGQQESELLFPNAEGGFRNEHVLRKPFDEVAGLIGLHKKITPRGMRRTFNDLARIAHVESLVTRSISGHKTERMREHYSTVSADEQRESIGRVLQLVKPEGSGALGGAPGQDVVPPGKKRAG